VKSPTVYETLNYDAVNTVADYCVAVLVGCGPGFAHPSVRLSVCPSVCPTPAHNLKSKGCGNAQNWCERSAGQEKLLCQLFIFSV